MMRGAIRRGVFFFIGRALSLLGFAGMVGIATPVSANVERERAALGKRIEIARENLRSAAQDAAPYQDDGARPDRIAQSSKRPNWNNWPKWNNWSNWSNR